MQLLDGDLLALLSGNPGVDQRKLNVLKGCQPRQQLEGLENKANFMAAQLGQLMLVHPADVLALQPVFAAGGRVQTADHVHQRGFSASGRAENGQKFAPLHLQMDALQDAEFFPRHVVFFDDVFH